MTKKPFPPIIRACRILKGKSALARAVGVSPPTVQQWASSVRPVPPKHCVSIESLTDRKVKRQHLRPLDWHLIWPELIPADQIVKAALSTDDAQPETGGVIDEEGSE